MTRFSTFGRTAGSVFSLLIACASTSAIGQTFPDRTISIIWPYSAGSTTDGFLRLVAAEASKSLGQTVIIENRSGALGRLALNAIKTSKNDGYTLAGVSTGELVTQSLASARLRMEPRKDYVPVVGLFNVYLLLIAHPSMPFRDLNGLIAHAKANPGKLNFSSGSTGGPAHLTLEFLKMKTGVDIVYVAYRGSAQSTRALAGGEVQLNVSDTNTSKNLIESGKAIGIAAVSPERLKPVPSLPTMAESGMPGFSSETFIGIVAPAGTPAAIVSRLNQAIAAAVRTSVVQERIEKVGYVVTGGSPDDFYDQIKSAENTLGPVVRKIGLKFE